MREYTYKARNIKGEIAQGSVEAENEQSASNLLTAQKLFAFEIKENAKQSISVPFLNKVRAKDKVFFIRQLATMTKAGLPVVQSLSTLGEQASSKPVKKMVEQMIRDVEAGDSLSSAFSKSNAFNVTEVSMITSGEASGKLDEVLENMAEQSEKNYRAIKKIRNTFIYPAFLLFVVTGIVIIMLVYVLPQMKSLYESFGNATLPLPTRILIIMSDALRKFYIVFIALTIAIVVGLRMYIKTESGKYIWHSLKLKMPLMGQFLKMAYMSMFTHTLSGLVASGVPILDALRIVSDTMTNVVYRDAVLAVQEKVKQGKNLSNSLKEDNLFPVMLSQMVGVGENTGELDTMLKNLANYYNDELDNWVKSFQSLLEPIMIVTMGGIVGAIILAIIMPIYNLSNVIK